MKFTEEELKKYLDDSIVYWKTKRDIARRKQPGSVFKSIESTEELRASYFIQAYESVRVDVFGSLKG